MTSMNVPEPMMSLAVQPVSNDSGEQVIQRSNSTAIAVTNVADIPPDMVYAGAVDLFMDIRREYTKKLEESRERATNIQANLAVEEHRGQELERVLKELVPYPMTPNLQNYRPAGKAIQRSNAIVSAVTDVADVPPDVIYLGAVELSMYIRREYAKKLEEKDEIPKDSFVRHMKGIVGDHMLTIALTKVQSQTRPNQGAAGQQLPVRMPSVGSGARQLNDPYALAQLHQRSMNAAADQSRIDAKIESQGLQTSQLPSSTSSQEIERSSVHIQGLNKQQQQHLHFSSAYGSSAVVKYGLKGLGNDVERCLSMLHDLHFVGLMSQQRRNLGFHLQNWL